MPIVRPQGTLCTAFVYPDKKSPYEKLLEFLFDNTSGRTDVVFFSSKATGKENFSELSDSVQQGDETPFVGGFVDGFAKAILQGNATISRTGRSLYGTPVFFGYHSNRSQGFDRWNSTTWTGANPKGYGGFLTGCSSYYGNWAYWKSNSATDYTTTTSNFGYAPGAIGTGSTYTSSIYPQYDENTGDINLVNLGTVWTNAFAQIDLGPPSPLRSKTLKYNFQLANTFGLLNTSYWHGAAGPSLKDSFLSTTTAFATTFTTTPEQPQRYWNERNAWQVRNDARIPIGIGLIENGVVISLTSPATTYGYVPTGLAVGQTTAQVLANTDPVGKLTIIQYINNNLTEVANQGTSIGTSSLTNWHALVTDAPTEFRPWLQQRFGNTQIIVRWYTIQELITKFGLNFRTFTTTNTVTNETDWNTIDGLNIGIVRLFRSMWANTNTTIAVDLSSFQTVFENEYWNKFGIATDTSSASSFQIGKPLMWYWGRRPLELTCGINNSYEISGWRFQQSTQYPSGDQINGFPVLLTTILPSHFFMVQGADNANLASASNTVYRNRGIIVRRDLGFFNTGIINTGGYWFTSSNKLGKPAVFSKSPFYSAGFKYVVNSYHLERYSDYPGGDPITNPNIRCTVQGLTSIDVAGTVRLNTLISLTGPLKSSQNGVPAPSNTETVAAGELSTRRKAIRTINTINVDLSNAAYAADEYLKFSFLGDGANVADSKTNGDLMITTHYGVNSLDTNGIAFHNLQIENHFRTGDQGYQWDAGQSTRAAQTLEFFKAIVDRQTTTSLGGQNNKKKLVIMMEVGVWEAANPNFSYNGINTWTYLRNTIPYLPEAATGTAAGSCGFAAGFNCIEYAINFALIAGFKREEIVIFYYTPTMLSTVSTVSQGTLSGINYNTIADERSLITSVNRRSSFTRSKEIFFNTFLYKKGFFNTEVTNLDGSPNAKNCLYVNMADAGLNTYLSNIDEGAEPNTQSWYAPIGLIGETNYSEYSHDGSLALGVKFADYLSQQIVPPIFIPTWLKPFSTILGYTTDPVSGSDLVFCSPTLDKVDLEPYYVAFDLLCDANNTQAKRLLSRFKTKILQ